MNSLQECRRCAYGRRFRPSHNDRDTKLKRVDVPACTVAALLVQLGAVAAYQLNEAARRHESGCLSQHHRLYYAAEVCI